MEFELTVETPVNSSTLRSRRYRSTEKGKANDIKVAAKSRAVREAKKARMSKKRK